MIRILESSQVGRLLARRTARFTEAEAVVRPIIDDVRKRGDKAVLEYARKFDGLNRKTARVPEVELERAAAGLPSEFKQAVEVASRNIRRYAQFQLPQERNRIDVAPGIRAGQIMRPLDAIAAYIPAGRYPLPSTVMMTVIPAQVAAVPNISITTPRPVAEILGTAQLLGVSNVFLLGGAHAIAAFAYGTRTIPKADRIVGPGNIYVA